MDGNRVASRAATGKPEGVGKNSLSMEHKLQDKIKKFQHYLRKLLTYAEIPDNELTDPKKEASLLAMERFFQLMVDEAIDINTELIQLKANKIPDTYRGTFIELPSIGILNRSFADKLVGSVKIRNHIVHEYEDMKISEVTRYIKQYAEMYKEY